MKRVRRKDTSLEIVVAGALAARGLRFSKHADDLPGSPDVLFRKERVAVFVDGDFWHGWRLPAWRYTLKTFWRDKLERNRIRDRRVHRYLRRKGWTVVRLWQHQVERDLSSCIRRVERALKGC